MLVRRVALVALLLVSACSGPASPSHAHRQPPLAPITAISGGPMTPTQAALDIERIDLTLRVNPATKTIRGIADLLLHTKANLAFLELDLDPELQIDEISIDGRTLARTAWSDPDGLLRIQLPKALVANSKVDARIAYGGTPHVAKRAPWDGGFVWTKTSDGQPWVASAVEGEGCDLIWPCLDFPMKRPGVATLHFTVPPGLAAPANGVLLGVDTSPDGWRTYNWRVKCPVTYAIAVNVGPYEVLQSTYHSFRYDNDIPMQFWYLRGHRKQAEALFAEVPRMVAFEEATIGPYPFGGEKIGMVETPYEGMEHQTINAYGAGYAITGAGYDELLQHELSHEWFGNQVTNRDWADMWIHEGFATYMHALYSSYLKGDQYYHYLIHTFKLDIKNRYPIAPGGVRTEHQISFDANGPGQDIYDKGALVLDTLRHLIGDKAFFQACTTLVYGRPDPKPGNFSPVYASTDDFINIVNRVSHRNLDWFFRAYLRNAALPELIETRTSAGLQLEWETADEGRFPMPLQVRVGQRIIQLPMADGRGFIPLTAGELYTIDPRSLVLRRDRDIEAWQVYKAAHPNGPPLPPAQRQ
jgi:aminopeptidase N